MAEIQVETTEKLPRLPSVKSLSISQNTDFGFKCSSCQMSFESQDGLKVHLSLVDKSVPCSLCSKKFLTVKAMRQHFGKKHERFRPFSCSTCFRTFRNFYAARIHEQQVHLHTSRRNCEYCQKSVYNKYSLTRHYSICSKKKEEMNASK